MTAHAKMVVASKLTTVEPCVTYTRPDAPEEAAVSIYFGDGNNGTITGLTTASARQLMLQLDEAISLAERGIFATGTRG